MTGQFQQPAPINVFVYNNTLFGATLGAFIGIDFEIGTTGAIRNNIVYAPSAAGPAAVINSGTATASNNTGDVGSITMNPFTGGPFNSPADFRLKPGSYAINMGFTTTPVFTDFFGANRHLSGPIDMGAMEAP
jgi:hypothetical protein